MKETLRYGLTLSVICAIASASLALVNSLTGPKILAQAQLEEEESLKQVFPKAAKFESVIKKPQGDVFYYRALDDKQRVIGIVFKTSQKGYSSVIETLAGLTPEGRITAIKVLSQNETPGLGAQVEGQDFTGQFKGKNIQDLGGVQAITGATVSSRAIIDSVKMKAKELMEAIKDGQ